MPQFPSDPWEPEQARAWLALLRDNRKKLERLTRRYPLYVDYEGRRHIFLGLGDVDALVDKLGEIVQ